MTDIEQNTCFSGNECFSTPGTDTQVTINISPYFPLRNHKPSPQSGGRSWLGNGSWGDFGHNRSNGMRSHSGCDIYVHAEGEPVYAVKSGTIILVEQPSSSWGGAGAITIDHGDFIARYGETRNFSQTSGSVFQGQQIADVSNTTYYPAQPMLHFEMYSKSANGPLTVPPPGKLINNRGTRRRADLIDPTSYLETWINNLPPES